MKLSTEESLLASPLPTKDRDPDLERELSNIMYSTIACTLADPDSINFQVDAAVRMIVDVLTRSTHQKENSR